MFNYSRISRVFAISSRGDRIKQKTKQILMDTRDLSTEVEKLDGGSKANWNSGSCWKPARLFTESYLQIHDAYLRSCSV